MVETRAIPPQAPDGAFPPAEASSRHPAPLAALVTLVALAALLPWAFGGTQPWAVYATTVVTLLVGTIAWAWIAIRGPVAPLPTPAWPALGLLLLAAAQLIPLTPALHALIAPGSFRIWHPVDPVVAAVLGTGAHPVSIHPEATLRWLALACGLLSLTLLAAPALRNRVVALRSTFVLLAAALAVALYGLVAPTLFGAKIYGVFRVPTTIPFGSFVSKNHFAGYLELGALLALGLAVGLADSERRGRGWFSWTDSPRAHRVIGAFGVALALALAVPVSLSRGGMLALGVGVVALPLYHAAVRRVRSWYRIAIAVGAALFLAAMFMATVVPQEVGDRLRTLFHARTEVGSAYRLAMWQDALRLAASSPIVGQGMGAFGDALPPFKTAAGEAKVLNAENDYLEVFCDSGLAGLACLLTAVALLFRESLRRLAYQQDRLMRGLRLGALAALTAVAAHACVDFNLRIPSTAALACVLAALLLSLVVARPAPSPNGGRLGACVLAVFGGAALVAFVVAGPLRETRPSLGPLAKQPLRLERLRGTLAAYVQTRPADPDAGLVLAWLEGLEHHQDSAVALARHARELDPARGSFGKAIDKVIAQSSVPDHDPGGAPATDERANPIVR